MKAFYPLMLQPAVGTTVAHQALECRHALGAHLLGHTFGSQGRALSRCAKRIQEW